MGNNNKIEKRKELLMYALNTWKSEFGKKYHLRNKIQWEKRVPFFEKIFSSIHKYNAVIKSVLEVGAGCGYNLLAINKIYPDIRLCALEPNEYACNIMRKTGIIEVIQCGFEECENLESYDLVFTSGVLIHVPPSNLEYFYEKIFYLAKQYILINEYFSPTPEKIKYRGKVGLLFKRDYCSDILDMYKDRLVLVDYGFLYKRVEEVWDNTTWWLIKKI